MICHYSLLNCHSSSLWPTQSEKIGAFGGTIKELGIRIIKVGGGASTYVDLDSVVLTELDTSSEYITWMDSFGLVADPNFDSDGDGLRDLVEFALGTSPLERNYETVLGEMVGGAFRLTRLKESPTPWKVPQISSNGVRFPV
ncbi:MAG: thrombospondin type 3 repeat-containing protein [Akkermansiaceae bacterium]